MGFATAMAPFESDDRLARAISLSLNIPDRCIYPAMSIRTSLKRGDRDRRWTGRDNAARPVTAVIVGD